VQNNAGFAGPDEWGGKHNGGRAQKEGHQEIPLTRNEHFSAAVISRNNCFAILPS
jgi:hypothetical protein